MRIFSEEINDRFRRKPVSSVFLLVFAVAAFGIIGEFSLGVIDGMMAELIDDV